jgi:hypothetical protein
MGPIYPPPCLRIEPVIAADFGLIERYLHFCFCQNFLLTVKIGRWFQLQRHLRETGAAIVSSRGDCSPVCQAAAALGKSALYGHRLDRQ